MLLQLLVFVLVAGLVYWLLTMLPLPEPFKKIVLVIFIVICIIWLLGYVVPIGNLFGPWPRR